MVRINRVLAGTLTCLAILWTGGILVGCQGVTTETAQEVTNSISANPLKGTDWRLVKFQSMSDAIGTERPDDPSLYTMRLNSDGTVSMRLNCNRANGTWSAKPSSNGSSGNFEFGPLAMTRALCLPPSMDESIAAQAGFIRSYLLKDGRLYLSLMADGGIYTWEPISAESSSAPQKKQ